MPGSVTGNVKECESEKQSGLGRPKSRILTASSPMTEMDTDYCNGSCTWTWQPNIKWARRHYYFKYVPLELIQWVCRVRGLGYGSRVLEYDLMCITVDRVFDTGVNMDCGLEACITLACCLHLYPVLCSRPG